MRRLSGRTGESFSFLLQEKFLEEAYSAPQRKEDMEVVERGKAERSQEVSTWVRITESDSRRGSYQAAGHTEED